MYGTAVIPARDGIRVRANATQRPRKIARPPYLSSMASARFQRRSPIQRPSRAARIRGPYRRPSRYAVESPASAAATRTTIVGPMSSVPTEARKPANSRTGSPGRNNPTTSPVSTATSAAMSR